MTKNRETILVLSAHSDDFVIGAGGTIANYAKEGKRVQVIVFSYGEKSHIWLKKNIVQKMRAEEAEQASKILKCNLKFFDLREGHFLEDLRKKNRNQELDQFINRIKPTKIFTHCGEDPHPDHRAVNKIALELYDKMEDKPEVYTYSVWNPVSFKTKFPALYVNVSKTFSLKLKALKTFESQRIAIAYPFLLLLYRAIKDGFRIRTKFGEHFFRIR